MGDGISNLGKEYLIIRRPSLTPDIGQYPVNVSTYSKDALRNYFYCGDTRRLQVPTGLPELQLIGGRSPDRHGGLESAATRVFPKAASNPAAECRALGNEKAPGSLCCDDLRFKTVGAGGLPGQGVPDCRLVWALLSFRIRSAISSSYRR